MDNQAAIGQNPNWNDEVPWRNGMENPTDEELTKVTILGWFCIQFRAASVLDFLPDVIELLRICLIIITFFCFLRLLAPDPTAGGTSRSGISLVCSAAMVRRSVGKMQAALVRCEVARDVCCIEWWVLRVFSFWCFFREREAGAVTKLLPYWHYICYAVLPTFDRYM